MFFLQQNLRTKGPNRFCLEVGCGRGEVAQIHIHVSACKNNEIIFKKTSLGKS
jgi:ubiquinone/menaquinone biosynthesis C-methylase UbiE